MTNCHKLTMKNLKHDEELEGRHTLFSSTGQSPFLTWISFQGGRQASYSSGQDWSKGRKNYAGPWIYLADVRVGAAKPQYSFDFVLTLSQREWCVCEVRHAWYLWEGERSKKVWSARCFSNFNLGMFLYLVLFSVWVILILLSILFSQISKWYSCIYLTSALFPLLCHRGFVRFTFPCLFQVLYCGVAHIFISFISFVAQRCTYILAKKCSCQCFCNFHHCS